MTHARYNKMRSDDDIEDRITILRMDAEKASFDARNRHLLTEYTLRLLVLADRLTPDEIDDLNKPEPLRLAAIAESLWLYCHKDYQHVPGL